MIWSRNGLRKQNKHGEVQWSGRDAPFAAAYLTVKRFLAGQTHTIVTNKTDATEPGHGQPGRTPKPTWGRAFRTYGARRKEPSFSTKP